jgi:ABC-type multidrug transport system fused ATPase/permease subunit
VRPIEFSEADRRPLAEGCLRAAIGLLGGRQRLMLVLLTLGKIAVGFCDLLVAAAMYQLFLLLQGHATGHRLWWIPQTSLSAAMIATGLVVVRGLLDLFSSRAAFRQVQDLQTDFISRLTAGYSQLQWGRFVECNRSELSGHALHSAREAADFYYGCIEITANVVIVAAMAAALVYQSAIAALTLGCVVAMFYGGHRLLVRKRLQEAASRRETALRMLQRNLADMLSSGKEIRTYGNSSFFQDRILRQARLAALNHLRVLGLPHLTRIVADQGAVLVFLSIVITVQLRHGEANRLLSLLVFYFVLSRRLLPLISQISFIAGQMDGFYHSVMVVESELNKCRLYRTPSLPPYLPDAGMVLQLDQVRFSWNEAPILRLVDLHIAEGELIVIHGVSGSGKSSLLNLIAGIIEPRSGAVRVDRATIAYVPQEVPLLDESVRSNLLFGLSDKSDEDLMCALAIAKLEEFVAAQPLGLDTSVGDNGALFSGGQRQRLGLARAILRDSQLLLLDEATSALDEENERQVLESLIGSGKAIVLATHRIQTQKFANRVFRLEGGFLIEEDGGELSTAGHTSSASVCSKNLSKT